MCETVCEGDREPGSSPRGVLAAGGEAMTWDPRGPQRVPQESPLLSHLSEAEGGSSARRFSWGMSADDRFLGDSLGETAPLLAPAPASPWVTLDLCFGPQFPSFQNAEYSSVVSSVSTGF